MSEVAMGDRHDYVALEWVKGEIGETLRQARQALEAYVENPADAARIRFCLTYVHQVHGTLQMVEFYGAALLAEEMEQLARALDEGTVANRNEALEVLMQAILQMPNYLDRVQGARRDLPMVVLPLLNDLRAARGEKLLSETSLFTPDLTVQQPALSEASLEQLSTAELPALLRKLRQMLQVALVGVVRSQDLPTNLGYMARVFGRLDTLGREAPLGPLWEIAAGLVEGMAAGVIVNGSSVRTLLRQVDRELKRLVEQGAAGFNQPAPDELTKNLLFYIAKAPGETPRIAALKRRYRLDEALPEAHLVDEARAQLAGPDRGAMHSVVTALCEELVRVKDALDLFVRSDRKVTAELEGLAGPLKQIADTLAMLGFGQPRKIVLDQLAALRAVVDGVTQPTDAVLMDVAGALLYVEATLAGMAGASQDERGSEQSRLPTTDVGQIHKLVIKEARTALEQAKDAIIEFIASQWNHDHLALVPELLTQARGGLAMIPLARAAGLLDACNLYIRQELLAPKAVPDWQSLDTLADAITSVEYYLERLTEDHASHGDAILDVAEESLSALGYALAPVAEVLASDEVSHEAPQANGACETPSFTPESLEPAAPDAPDEPLTLELDDSIDYLSLDEPGPVASASEPGAEAAGSDAVSSPVCEGLSLADDVFPGSVFDESALSAPESLAIDLDQPELADKCAAATDLPAQTLESIMAAPVQAINPPAAQMPPSLLPPPADEEPVDDELAEVFIEEAGEVLETLLAHLPAWFADAENREALTEIRRAFHTLKGSGRMVRALVIGELAWSIENMLNRVLDRSIAVTGPVHAVVEQVVAVLPSLIDEYAAKAQRQRDDVDALAATAQALAQGRVLPSTPEVLDEPATSGADLAIATNKATNEPASTAALVEEGMLDPQLLEIFRNEAETHLDTLDAFLAECAERLPQPVTDSLQRALHTLKGSAHMAGIAPMAEVATPLEKMVKEFKAHQIDVDLAAAELLRDAATLFRDGLSRLAADAPLNHIEGADAFIERVHQLHRDRLEAAEAAIEGDGGEARDPRMISLFLSEGMNILLDAEDLLRSWRAHPAERQELTALLEELTTLGLGAQMANLPQIDALSQALLRLYGLAQEGQLVVSPRFFDEVEQGHEALVGMMDQLAAGLEVGDRPEVVARLQALLADAQREAQVFEPDAPQPDEADAVPLGEAVTVAAVAADFEQEGEAAWAMDPTPTPTIEATAFEPLESLDEEMVEIFLDEAVDLLDSASQALDRWLADPQDGLALGALQRDLHTLKGGARMAEIRPIGDLAHELESLYEGLVDRRFSASPELAGLLQRSHDQLAAQLEQLQRRQPMTLAASLIDAIRAFRSGRVPEPVAETATLPLPEVHDLIELSAEAPWATEALELDESDLADDSNEPVELSLDDALFLPPGETLDAVEFEPDTPDTPDTPEVSETVETATPSAATDLSVDNGTPNEPLPSPMSQPDSWGERDAELVEIFLDEGLDIIDSASAALQRWMADVDNSIDLEALQRDLHTLKGGARMAEIREIGDLAHELESLYEGLCGGRVRPGPQLFSLLQTSHDRLADMLEALREHRPLPDGLALIGMIRAFRLNPDQQLSAPQAVSLKAHETAGESSSAETEILDIFIEEAGDLLEAFEGALNRWNDDPQGAALDDMLRVLHTLKGGARLAGQRALGDVAHDLEQLLGEARQSASPLSLLSDAQNAHEAMLAMVDELRARLEGGDSAPAGPRAAAEPMMPTLSAPIIAASTAPVEPSGPAKILPFVRRAQDAAAAATARRAPQEMVKVPADLLEGLVNLAGETSIFRGRVEQQVSDVSFTLGEMEATIERVRDQLRRLDTETQAQILSRYQAEAERAGYEDFDPLEMDRHSQLQQLSRALFESASDLLDLKETLAARNRDAETLLLQQARVNTELQEGLMRTRMVPFDRLVPRLRRIVRQVASELGKQVDFLVGNAEGEMDRTVLERIVAPLEHMLRNAVDHGIETTERRLTAGKPTQGTIRLDLGREGGDIVLVLGDDGGGIDLAAVRRKAIERGLMRADSELTDSEVLQFILEAGFSTAERVTQISGRGVGMDVVHSEVKQLGGSMHIESSAGQGTRFVIRLPFTVSVNRALMVYSGDDLYAIPLNTIEGIVRVSPYELESYYQPGAPRFEYAGEAYELRYLGELLNNGQHPKLGAQSLPLPVILVRSSEHAVAVQVDSLAGSREIVVKSLGAQFAAVHGISGATILGDGRVVVILDLLATIRGLHSQQLPQGRRPVALVDAVPERDVDRPILAMVVDDSVTVRKVTSRLLERNGMNVLTAKDGVDAITQLQDHRPDVMLLDIEMPRMDGFEVASLVRHDERLKDLPIIMITSRTGEKHRERAMSIGVNEYLGKPYQESELLETIQRLVHIDD